MSSELLVTSGQLTEDPDQAIISVWTRRDVTRSRGYMQKKWGRREQLEGPVDPEQGSGCPEGLVGKKWEV